MKHNSTVSGDQIHATHQHCSWRSDPQHPTVRCLESKCMAPTSSVPGFQNDTTHKPWTWKANSHHPTEQCLDIQFTPPTSSGSWCPLAMCSLSLGWFIFWNVTYVEEGSKYHGNSGFSCFILILCCPVCWPGRVTQCSHSFCLLRLQFEKHLKLMGFGSSFI